MRKLRVVILCHNDLTSNLIFGPLVESNTAEIIAVCLQSSPDRAHSGLVRGALGIRRKTSSRYWLFLVVVNMLHLFVSYLSILGRIDLRLVGQRPLQRAARAHGLVTQIIADFNESQFLDYLRTIEPDVILVRIGTILRRDFLSIPKLGTFCVHSSLLPSYAGIAAEFHAMRSGDKSLGTTIFRVSDELDRGDILLQVSPLSQSWSCLLSAIVANNVAASQLLISFVDSLQRDPNCFSESLKAVTKASYFSWPTDSQVNEFKGRHLRLICYKAVRQLIKPI